MKITIEPTEPKASVLYPTVVLSVPSDDLDLTETLDLITSALKAWGFDHLNDLEPVNF